MKNRMILMGALCAMLNFSSSCVILDTLGMKSGVPGAELKAQISQAALIGGMFGCELYIAGKNISGTKCSDYKDYMTGLLMTYIITPSSASVDEGKSYSEKSAEACLESVNTQAIGNTIIALSMNETNFGSFSATSNADFPTAMAIGGILTASSCELEEAGMIVEAGGVSF